ncbi:MAG TPA: TPM domain-containing protein [Candidatus Limnocylindria bacterium]|nr:TPM domain-containing protein [Candidatus Limnocylindria bacterium]
MKKTLVFAAALLLFVVPVFAASATAGPESGLRHVADNANRLSPAEEADLNAMAADLFARSGFDVILHTTSNSLGKGPENYSRDFYLSFRDTARYPNGALLAIMYDTRDYHEAAIGTGIELLTHRENYDLRDVVQQKLTDGNVYGAMRDYVRYVRRIVIPPTPLERMLELAPFVLAGGLVAGLLHALYLRSKLSIARFASSAAGYMVPGSLQLTQSDDIYLYQTVTRTYIQPSSGGGGGRGGGFSSGSRGGVSFGGRGGKF